MTAADLAADGSWRRVIVGPGRHAGVVNQRRPTRQAKYLTTAARRLVAVAEWLRRSV